jgi:hypothetical protein
VRGQRQCCQPGNCCNEVSSPHGCAFPDGHHYSPELLRDQAVECPLRSKADEAAWLPDVRICENNR